MILSCYNDLCIYCILWLFGNKHKQTINYTLKKMTMTSKHNYCIYEWYIQCHLVWWLWQLSNGLYNILFLRECRLQQSYLKIDKYYSYLTIYINSSGGGGRPFYVNARVVLPSFCVWRDDTFCKFYLSKFHTKQDLVFK